jgi:hypothetical protein
VGAEHLSVLPTELSRALVIDPERGLGRVELSTSSRYLREVAGSIARGAGIVTTVTVLVRNRADTASDRAWASAGKTRESAVPSVPPAGG